MDEFFKNNPNLFGNNTNIPNMNNINTRLYYSNSNNNINKTKTKVKRNNSNAPYNYTKNPAMIRSSAGNLNFNNENSQHKAQPFIIGKFGRKTVVSQDLNTFMSKMKKAEWTTNPSYLIAKDIKIQTDLGKNIKENEFDLPKYSTNIDKLYLHLNKINFSDYTNYVNEINNRKDKLKEEAKKEKEEFLKNNFPNEGKLHLNSILNRIRNNPMSFISKDQILYNKIYQSMNY